MAMTLLLQAGSIPAVCTEALLLQPVYDDAVDADFEQPDFVDAVFTDAVVAEFLLQDAMMLATVALQQSAALAVTAAAALEHMVAQSAPSMSFYRNTH
jgi:hypothetical protein